MRKVTIVPEPASRPFKKCKSCGDIMPPDGNAICFTCARQEQFDRRNQPSERAIDKAIQNPDVDARERRGEKNS